MSCFKKTSNKVGNLISEAILLKGTNGDLI